MVPLTSLWLPILVAAVIVFVASFILHMVLPLHRSDLRKLPQEDAVLEALRRFDVPPGDYAAPHAASPAAMKDPAFVERMQKGPLVLLTLSPGQAPSMATALVLWFVYALVVGVFAAYVAGRALGPGESYLEVFRFAGTTAFLGYALALAQHSIWYRRSWVTTFKSMFDGLVYALL
ncbi:MAG TPA: hypothetical protein VMT87_12280, partial [Vicinamibacteria bacterium]|nr:hypothetical protein [Vicinamibacteria bacterium]